MSDPETTGEQADVTEVAADAVAATAGKSPRSDEPGDAGPPDKARWERRNAELASENRTLREALAQAKAATEEKIASVTADAEAKESELRTQLERLEVGRARDKVESRLLDAVIAESRDLVRRVIISEEAEGFDMLGDGAEDAMRDKIRELVPQAYSQPPVKQSKPDGLDVTGKTWATLTPEELSYVKTRPELIRQLNNAGSSVPRMGIRRNH